MSKAPFKIYNASAGAGKTYNLVYNFLTLCLGSPLPVKFRSILAITFTNKAAREMKERILKALYSFRQYPDSGKEKPMFEQMMQETGLSEEELKKRSSEVLRSVLHQYSAFSVSTIDKFTNRLIKTFAGDLKLSVNYEVELDSERILEEAIDRMLSELEENSPLSELLIQFLNTQLEEGKSPRAETRLLDTGKSLFQEEAIIPISLLKAVDSREFIKIRNQLYRRNRQMENQIEELARQVYSLIHENQIDPSLFAYADLPNYLNAVLNGECFKIPGKRLMEQISGEKSLYSKSNAREGASLIDPVAPELSERFNRLVDFVTENYAVYKISDQILKNIFGLGVLAEIERNLEEIKIETNRLPIGEFNKLISNRLKEQPAAFLYERVGDRYQHYFIDEFQDTSRLQWHNLIPLVNNAMAQGGSAMLVGDGKQSIYRWRGGDAEQFLDLHQDTDKSNRISVNGELQMLYKRETVVLGGNYRSKSNIVNFNNLFFKEIINITDSKGESKFINTRYRELFEKAIQEIKGDEGGYVEMQRFEWENPEAYEVQQCERCLAIIREALDDGYECKDIAILNRKKSNSAVLSKYLTSNGIDVVSPDSLTVEQSGEVMAVMAFLQILLRPDDKQGRLPFLEILYEKGEQQEKHLFLAKWAHASAADLLRYIETVFPGLRIQQLNKLPLTEKIREVTDALDFDVAGDPFLQSLLDMTVDFERNAHDSEAGFLRWWELTGRNRAVDLPEELNAVRMMTIHKAKGLEFPVVILAFADWKAFTEVQSPVWLELPPTGFFGLPAAQINLCRLEELPGTEAYQEIYNRNKDNILLDNLNLLYVALTRPEERLYILGAEGWQDTQRVTAYLKHFVQQQGSEDLFWSAGEKQPRTVSGAGAGNRENLRPYQRVHWQDRLKVSTGSPENWEGGESEHTSRGKKIHTLLAHIRYTSEAETVLKNMIRNGYFDPEDETRLSNMLYEVLHHPELAFCFEKDNGVINEGEILLPGSGSLRPDRLVLADGEVHIIDYKTGVAAESHREQVTVYARLLKEMGYAVGNKFLVYLNEGVEVVKW